MGAAELRGERVEAVAAAGGEDEIVAPGPALAGEFGAEARGRAGDEGDRPPRHLRP
jgi:hypothetical protein